MLPPGLCWQTPAWTLHPAWRPVEANCGGNEKEAKQRHNPDYSWKERNLPMRKTQVTVL